MPISVFFASFLSFLLHFFCFEIARLQHSRSYDTARKSNAWEPEAMIHVVIASVHCSVFVNYSFFCFRYVIYGFVIMQELGRLSKEKETKS